MRSDMKTKIVLCIFCFVLIGCAEVIQSQFAGPNGRTAYNMRCSGMGRNMDKCYKIASEVCPKGYDIIENTATSVGVYRVQKRSMAIECKE